MSIHLELTRREARILALLVDTPRRMRSEIAERLAREYEVPVARIRDTERAVIEAVRKIGR